MCPSESSLQATCASISRCWSLNQLVSLTAAAAAETCVDVGAMGYIVDPVCEMSDPADVPAYMPPLMPTFQEKVLGPYGASWKGLSGAPNVVPSQSEYQTVVREAQSFTFLGPGRFLSTFTGKMLTAVNAKHCSSALVLDQMLNERSLARQTRYDNMRRPHERVVETAENSALLLMMRGVKAAVVNTMPSTSYVNSEVASGIFKNLTDGMNLAAAVRAATESLGFELDCAKSTVVHYGLPLMIGNSGGGAAAGKGGKKK